MPFCPECREEYDEGVEECVDCYAVLVGSMDDIPEKKENLPDIPEVSLYGESPEVAEYMRLNLVDSSIPAYVDKEIFSVGERKGLSRVAVPKEFFEGALRYLTGHCPALVVEDIKGSPVFSRYAEGKSDEIRDPEIFRKGLRKVVKIGEPVLPELTRIAIKGDAEARRLAILAMARIGGQGLYTLVEMLKKACVVGDLPLFQALFKGMHSEYSKRPVLFEDFFELFKKGEKHVRILSMRAAAKLGGKPGIPFLISMLGDEDENIQEEASEALFHITGDDMGFDSSLQGEQKNEIIAKWNEWWNGMVGK